MAALIASDEPFKTAAALAEGPLNLYKTLEPMHLAKAMATGLITLGCITGVDVANSDTHTEDTGGHHLGAGRAPDADSVR